MEVVGREVGGGSVRLLDVESLGSSLLVILLLELIDRGCSDRVSL